MSSANPVRPVQLNEHMPRRGRAPPRQRPSSLVAELDAERRNPVAATPPLHFDPPASPPPPVAAAHAVTVITSPNVCAVAKSYVNSWMKKYGGIAAVIGILSVALIATLALAALTFFSMGGHWLIVGSVCVGLATSVVVLPIAIAVREIDYQYHRPFNLVSEILSLLKATDEDIGDGLLKAKEEDRAKLQEANEKLKVTKECFLQFLVENPRFIPQIERFVHSVKMARQKGMDEGLEETNRALYKEFTELMITMPSPQAGRDEITPEKATQDFLYNIFNTFYPMTSQLITDYLDLLITPQQALQEEDVANRRGKNSTLSQFIEIERTTIGSLSAKKENPFDISPIKITLNITLTHKFTRTSKTVAVPFEVNGVNYDGIVRENGAFSEYKDIVTKTLTEDPNAVFDHFGKDNGRARAESEHGNQEYEDMEQFGFLLAAQQVKIALQKALIEIFS